MLIFCSFPKGYRCNICRVPYDLTANINSGTRRRSLRRCCRFCILRLFFMLLLLTVRNQNLQLRVTASVVIYVLNFVKICEAAQNWDGGTTGTVVVYFLFLWRLDPFPDHGGSYGASRSHSLDTSHSVELPWKRDQPDGETNTWKQAIQTFMPPVGFEPTITASEWPQIDSFYLRSLHFALTSQLYHNFRA
jgi:hypothetical protein